MAWARLTAADRGKVLAERREKFWAANRPTEGRMTPLPTVPPAAAAAPPLPPLHVEVRFGAGVDADTQARALFALERHLREDLGVPAEVFKRTMPDDLKRRRDMTPGERDLL